MVNSHSHKIVCVITPTAFSFSQYYILASHRCREIVESCVVDIVPVSIRERVREITGVVPNEDAGVAYSMSAAVSVHH